MNNIQFKDLNLSQDLFKAIKDMGFENVTPIQGRAIPAVLKGGDVIGLASTGTGKTAAFGLPLIDKIDAKDKNIQALILCPTRELAMQVAGEFKKFLKYKKGISVLAIYGGQNIRKQIFDLRKRPQIIVGTPGRVMDHMERRTLSFKNAKIAVLDEADEMLNMGFRQDIEFILKTANKERQTLLFSATMSRDIMQLTKKYQKDPIIIKVAKEKQDTSLIEQSYFDIEAPYKIDMLMDLINKYELKRAIVFCNTKRKVDKISRVLSETGFNAAGIHGDHRQAKRDNIMRRFRSGKINFLIATDVAARGIDVNDIQAIFNFEIPRETESYVHRIGRTGRAGKKGKAFSFVSRDEFKLFRNIVRYVKHNIKKDGGELLTLTKDKSSLINKSFDNKTNNDYKENRIEKKAERFLKRVKSTVDTEDHSLYLDIAQNFVDNDLSNQDLSAALLKMLVDSDKPRRSSRRFRR